MSFRLALACVLCLALHAGPTSARAQESNEIPRGQSKPPNEPLSPADAARRMTVPEGFSVEVFASEPDLVNPVAMTFDERGRAWVTESLEYPRRSPGVGRDRVRVLEDTDGDGKADKFTTFAEGLNIPSGIAVGHGGVWVANSPDLLFLRDTDGDGKADTREVVVSGFGRDDTHELPNSLSWGPDGWLYGWNGVFNASHVVYRGKTYDFTCAIFRIHPRTREFELFCEGTSNPWGITWDTEGSAFASACVIDHLWHLVESGYYHRQGGPYPPFTWKMESIADHKHQQAAYCGIHYYDSDAFPEAYRGTLFMGNIHGNCINRDRVRRKGATYVGSDEPDFLTSHDAWFMPVAQKTGPDGSLYILDWYDRYHCYQDANRDPAGIDRLKGRLYRVRYEGTPRRHGFDLGKASDGALVKLLGSGNGYDRETARRVLSERDGAATDRALRAIVEDPKADRRTALNALFAIAARPHPDPGFLQGLLGRDDPTLRAWGVRIAGNEGKAPDALREAIVGLAHDSSPDVLLQVAIASRKVEGMEPIGVLTEVLASCGGDGVIPPVVWQNLHPLLEDKESARRVVAAFTRERLKGSPGYLATAPRLIDRLLARRGLAEVSIAPLFQALLAAGNGASRGVAARGLEALAARVQSGEVSGEGLAALKGQMTPVLRSMLAGQDDPTLRSRAALLATSWGDREGIAAVREVFASTAQPESYRLQALNALIVSGDRSVLDALPGVLSGGKASAFGSQVLAALGKLDDPRVADVVLRSYAKLTPEQKPRAVELLTQRTAWGLALMEAIGRGEVPATALNVNQVRKLLASKDPALVKAVTTRWGTLREARNPRREQVVKEMQAFLAKTPGDPKAGALVFGKVRAQCHKMNGEGQDVGPDITRNGRGSYEQLLSNVFDPSLVIGAAFQGSTVATTDGRVLVGLVVEKSERRVVLKMQGGKLEVVPKEQVEEMALSPLSLMPEGLETQIPPQELADLFAYITLQEGEGPGGVRPIPGAESLPRRRANP